MKPAGKRFTLASKEPSIPLKDYVYEEARYTRIIKQNPEVAETLLEEAQADVDKKWLRIETLRNL